VVLTLLVSSRFSQFPRHIPTYRGVGDVEKVRLFPKFPFLAARKPVSGYRRIPPLMQLDDRRPTSVNGHPRLLRAKKSIILL
jgi:hypothetical protein